MPQLLPALRRAVIDPRMAEFKSLQIAGPGIIPTSVTLGAGSIYSRSANWNLDTVIQDAYERSVWVFKCVDLYANHAARLQLVLEQGDTTIVTHPLLKVLNRRANSHETGRQFKKRLAAQLLLSKKGVFVELTFSRAGILIRLDLLSPDRVQIVPDPHGEYVDYYQYTQPDGLVRDLPTERVVWIRDPHPTDPFSGVTPLEAAGISIELDYLARVYNNSFIKRDARPGGVIGVDTDQLDERELARIERAFSPGAHHAGKITAIGTGPGGIHYIDTSAKPRDMAYEHTSAKAKEEVLAAFGTPESMLGNTSGRTYDNAAQDEETFFGHFVNFLDIISDAFAQKVEQSDDEDEKILKHDTSSIEALELPKKRARAEAREEWDKGLRTAMEYRKMRPELETIDNAQTRALWFSPAKAPVPGSPEDAAELGLGGMAPGQGPEAGGQTAEDALADDALAEEAAGGAPATDAPIDPEAMPAAPAPQPAPAAAEPAAEPAGEPNRARQPGISQATGVYDNPRTETGAEPALSLSEEELPHDDDLELWESKELMAAVDAAIARGTTPHVPVLEVKVAPGDDTPGPTIYDPGEAELQRLEVAIKSAMDALLARQVGVVKARLESPKTRRGTRFWAPEYETDTRAGDNPIDTARVIAAERWAQETADTLAPILSPAAEEAATGLLTAMAASGALVAALGPVADVAGRAVEAPAVAAEQIAAAAGNAAQVATMVAVLAAGEAIREWLDDMRGRLDQHLIEAQPSLPELVGWVESNWPKKARALVDSLAVSIAQTLLGHARDGAADAAVPYAPNGGSPVGVVMRTWTTRQDERVRATHVAAEGQIQPLGEMFDVGGHDLRFPCDPLAPASETRWCRCWLKYQWPAASHFTLR